MTHAQRLEYQRNYYRTHKEQARAYAEKIKDKRREYNKRYYKDNKWKWKEIYIPREIVRQARKEVEK